MKLWVCVFACVRTLHSDRKQKACFITLYFDLCFFCSQNKGYKSCHRGGTLSKGAY